MEGYAQDIETTGTKSAKDRFPRIVIVIILAEFCERFSYSGMRAFLTLYLRSKLGYTDDGATEIYHIFSTLVYLFPIFGGILADNYLGKFRTILYMMFVYAAGNLIVAVTAIPFLEMPARLCTLLGLFMITIGTGGIKPCVTAFGGDQFTLPAQEKHLALYFSVLYFTVCTGSLIAKTVSPILRSEVTCFGDKDCYSLAFGAPGVVVIVSIVIFVSAKSRYKMKKPEGNVVYDFVKCVFLGVKNLLLKRHESPAQAHWLDSTHSHFEKTFVRDVKKTLSILKLFTVLPVFWSLLDQLGSRWTLQATKMDGRFWFITIKPDQMQVLVPTFILIIIPLTQKYIYPFLEKRNVLKNPLHKLTMGGVLAGVAFIASGVLEIYLKGSRWTLQATKMDGRFWFITIKPDQMQVLVPTFILIIIPLTQKYIYPFLEKRNVLKNPLHKLTMGGVLAGVAFIASGVLEIYLKTTYPVLPQAGISQLRIFNGDLCSLYLHSKEINLTYEVPPLANISKNDLAVFGRRNIAFDLVGCGAGSYEIKGENFELEENKAVSFFVNGGTVKRYIDNVDKSKSGFPVVRFLISKKLAGANITFYNENRREIEATIDGAVGVSPQYEMFASTYSIVVNGRVIRRDVNVESGGVYVVILEQTLQSYHSEIIVVTPANSISMVLLLPQFLIMSVAEVLFAVTGNEFAFKESPENMKAVMTAVWLLTDAMGNILIIGVTRLFVSFSQETQSFIYTGMMFTSITVFYYMSRHYKTNSVLETEEMGRKCRSNSEVLYQQVKQTEECLDH